jgi:hypothetical protein
MALEKIEMVINYLGSSDDFEAVSNKMLFHPGDTFYCWDTKATYIFASGDWREV